MNQHLAKIAEVLDSAELVDNLIRSKEGILIVRASNAAFDSSDQANAAAKLFKAAPKLLQALKDLVCYDSYSTEYDGCMYDICPSCGAKDGDHKLRCEFEFARAAIREATGEQA